MVTEFLCMHVGSNPALNKFLHTGKCTEKKQSVSLFVFFFEICSLTFFPFLTEGPSLNLPESELCAIVEGSVRDFWHSVTYRKSFFGNKICKRLLENFHTYFFRFRILAFLLIATTKLSICEQFR